MKYGQIILALFLAACSSGSGEAIQNLNPTGWPDGLYSVSYTGITAYIEVDGPMFSINGEAMTDLYWIDISPNREGTSGRWWSSEWRGYFVGLRSPLQFRVNGLVLKAVPVNLISAQ